MTRANPLTATLLTTAVTRTWIPGAGAGPA